MDAKPAQKSYFKREAGYIWAMLGSAIGFGNLLSFSSQCYHHGGGAFLIPYIIAILILGIPMLCLEGLIGNRLGLPLVSAYAAVAGRRAKFFGWLPIIAVTTIGGFYMVLTAFSVAYTYFAGSGTIPADTAGFFRDTFLHDSGSISKWGTLAIGIFCGTLVVALFSWIVIARKIQSGIERICSIFMPMLCLLVVGCAICVLFFPGAWQGFVYYLKPDFSKLGDFSLWRDVFGQLFFSFSLGIGIVTGYSRYTGETTSIRRAMLWVATGDFVVSFIAGFAIFGFVGYLSHLTGQPIQEIVKSESAFQMGFVIFPMIIQTFGPILSKLVGVLFFFCVFIAGITGVFSIVEALAGNIEVEFRKSRLFSVTLSLALMTCIGLLFCFGNGQYLLGALEPMVIGNNMLIGGIAEIIFFLFISKTVQKDPIWFNGPKRSLIYQSLRTLVLPILSLSLLGSITSEFQGDFGAAEWVRWGWLAIAAIIALGLSRTKRVEYRSLKPAVSLETQ